MVFEHVFANILNTYLSGFIDDVSSSQLQLGAWTGKVELKNLSVKENALDSLDVPFHIIHGRIGKLSADIPWSSLYTSPVVLNMSNILVVAAPTTNSDEDEEREEKMAQLMKRRMLESIEEALKKSKGKSDEKQATIDDFVAKLTAQIIKNVQVRINNVHIRFEDRVTDASCPYIGGITLEQLVFETQSNVDDNHTSEDIIHKLVSLQNFSIYYNVIKVDEEEDLFVSHLTPEERDEILLEGIADSENVPPDVNYLLKPTTLSANATINRKPHVDDFKYPVLDLGVAVNQFEMGFSSTQLDSLLILLDAMGRLKLAHPHRKLRPNVPLKSNANVWWKFAINTIIQNEIRRKNREWSWQHIFHHRKILREYIESYKQKLVKPHSVRIAEKIQDMENNLDVFNIILARRQAESQMRDVLEQKSLSQDQNQGWFSWLWGTPRQDLDVSINGTEEMPAVLNDLKTIMTPEEKEKLYAAIGYGETESIEAYPQSFAAHLLYIYVDAIKLIIKDDKSQSNIAEIGLLKVRANIKHRPSSKGFEVTSEVDDLVIHGVQHRLLTRDEMKGKTFYIEFTRHPIDEDYDYGVYMKTSPFHLVYDPQTIDSLFAMFRRPEETVSLQQLQLMAEQRLQRFKSLSATGLESAISQHKHLKLDIVFEPLFIIIPGGNLWSSGESCDAVILSLGRSGVVSETNDSSESESGYDSYKFSLSEVQLFISSSQTWKEDVGLQKGSPAVLLDRVVSNRSLLFPVKLEVILKKCLMIDTDPTLPRFKLRTAVPQILLKASETQITKILSVMRQFSAPSDRHTDHDNYQYPDGHDMSSIGLGHLDPGDISPDTFQNLKSLNSDVRNRRKRVIQNFVDLEASFEVNEVICHLFSGSLGLEGFEDNLVEVQIFKVKGEYEKRSHMFSVSFMVDSLLVIDAHQKLGKEFEILLASHKNLRIDTKSGNLEDAQKRLRSFSSVMSSIPPNPTPDDSVISLRYTRDDMDKWEKAAIVFTHFDVIATQETMIELFSFFKRIKSQQKSFYSSESKDHPGLNQPRTSISRVKRRFDSQIKLDFKQLNILLLQSMEQMKNSQEKKLATATISGASITANFKGKEVVSRGLLRA